MVVLGAVEGRARVMAGLRVDFNTILMAFVVEAARSAPGAGAVALVRSSCGLGGRGYWGWESLGRLYCSTVSVV